MKQVEYYKNGNRTLRIKYEGIKKLLEKQNKEIERLNNIINDFEEELEREVNIKAIDTSLEYNTYIDINNTLKTVLKRFRELKGSDKE